MNRQLIRLRCDTTSIEPVLDDVTHRKPAFFQGTDLKIDVWAVSGNSPWNVGNVPYFEARLCDPAHPDDGPVIDQRVYASGFSSDYVTAEDYRNGLANVSFLIPASASSMISVQGNAQPFVLFVAAQIAENTVQASLTVSLGVSGSSATGNTSPPHGLSSGETVIVEGASHSYLNGTFAVNVIDAHHFSYVPSVSGVGFVIDLGTVESKFASVIVGKSVCDVLYNEPQLPPFIIAQPQALVLDLVPPTTGSFNVIATSALPLLYRWQVSTDSGITWVDTVDGADYTGSSSDTLGISNDFALNGNYFRVLVMSAVGIVESAAALLTFR